MSGNETQAGERTAEDEHESESESESKSESENGAGSGAGRTVAIEKLAIMNLLGEIGADGVEERLGGMSSFEGQVVSEQVKCGFVVPDLLGCTFSDEERLGSMTRLPGVPYGYALVLLSKPSAGNAAGLLLSVAYDDLSEVSDELAHSALIELGGIMANGFLDAWADTFDQRIDVGAPTPVHDTERAIVGRVLGAGDDLGLYIASRLHVPSYDIHADVYLFPQTATFIEILNRLDVSRVTA